METKNNEVGGVREVGRRVGLRTKLGTSQKDISYGELVSDIIPYGKLNIVHGRQDW